MAEIGHGGKPIVERIMEKSAAAAKIKGLTQIPIRSQIANEVIGISYASSAAGRLHGKSRR